MGAGEKNGNILEIVNENAIQPALMLNPCQVIIQSGQYIFHHDFVLKNKITTLHTAFFLENLAVNLLLVEIIMPNTLGGDQG